MPVLRGLAARGLLTDAAPVAGGATSSQLTAVALPGAPPPAEAAPTLAHAAVAVAGCGPVGGHVAVLLAKAGVGHLVLADGRPVGSREVGVSPVLPADAEGRSRVEAVSAQTRPTGAATDAVDRLHDLPANDVVVVECGYDGAGEAVADACMAAGTPYLGHTQDALRAEIGPLVGPGGEPCHRCALTRRLSHLPHPDEHDAYRRARAAGVAGPDAFLAAHSAIVAGLVAVEVLRTLLGARPLSRGALLTLDLATMELGREPLLPVPGCPGCARARREV